MTQDTFPEIQAATQALEKRIALTEAEVAQMKEGVKARKAMLRSWRKALVAFNPKRGASKKRVADDRSERRTANGSAAELAS